MGHIDNFLNDEYLIEELIIPNGTKVIDKNYFSKYKNLKRVILPEGITQIGNGAFSGCEHLEEIVIPDSVTSIGSEAFKDCISLRKITLPNGLMEISDKCFYNCTNLVDINLSDTISYIGNEAFKYCHSIPNLTIPANLKDFGLGAFSYMDSLETIEVSPYNKTFITPDNKILIDQMRQKLVLYASGCKDKSYTLKDYVIELDGLNREVIRPISYIGACAFSGNKYLEELTVCGCTDNIEYNAFDGCLNLKTLNVEGISLFTCLGFRIRENGQYYFDEQIDFPFETVNFKGHIVDIGTNALKGFSKVKKIVLPNNGSYSISSYAFNDCSVSHIHIPNNVSSIKRDAFNKNTILEFDNGLRIKGLVSLEKGRDYSKNITFIDNIRSHENDETELKDGFIKINPDGFLNSIYQTNKFLIDYDLYQLNDNDFYIDCGGKISEVSKTYIDNICTHPELIRDNPVLFFDFMKDLVEHDLVLQPLLNGILLSGMNLHSRKLLLENLDKNDGFFLEVLLNSGILDKKDDYTDFLLNHFELVLEKINLLKKYNVKDPEICHKLFMCCVSNEIFEELITTNYELLCKVIRDSDIRSLTDKTENPWGLQTLDIINNKDLGDKLLSYINLIEGKDKDKFLMNYLFICNDSELCKKLIKNYDENIKRLIKASKILDGYNIKDIAQNFSDLLNLMEMTGGLDDDKITRQKACTFITEKIFDEKLPNGENNPFRIVGDDIHRIFNFSNTPVKYNKEFATFFLENYRDLHTEEMNHSGIIERIYNNFDNISKTCTSHKGSQRKLKVTMSKVLSFLEDNKFDNVSKKYRSLARLLGWWYDRNETWEKALMIYKESLKAPRNIFTKVDIVDGNICYDNNPDLDLKESISDDYSFEWLPKQDYHNLILGKYCNCCAHVEGAGQGIMRASMILDNCQNLVIRDSKGAIIAKSTLYVNKQEGYAVFNNVESSINNRDDEDLEKIYKAFMRGINAFVDVYNENNPHNLLNIVTIGSNRNTILNHLENKKHPEVPVKQSLSYGTYSINRWSGYNGDWAGKQRLVLKR